MNERHWILNVRVADDIQASDYAELRRITGLMQASPTPIASSSTSPESPAHQPSGTQSNEVPSSQFQGDTNTYARDGVRICASFVQGSSFLEDMVSPDGIREGESRQLFSPQLLLTVNFKGDARCLAEAADGVKGARELLLLFDDSESDGTSAAQCRIGAKVRRALDQLRRSALKCVDPTGPSRCSSPIRSQVTELLHAIVDVLEDAIKSTLR